MKILIIDNDAQLRRVLRSGLEHHDYEVETAESGERGLELVPQFEPVLIILDIDMPGMDGLETLKRLRTTSQTPVIVLSSHEHEDDKSAAMDLGADDFLIKPFTVNELLARIRAVLRRSLHEDVGIEEDVFEHGDLRVDYKHREVVFAGEKVHLTPKEYDLLSFMIHFRNRMLTHRLLLTKVWGEEFANETHMLRVHVANLRAKIEKNPAHPKHIHTEMRLGYRFKA